MKRQKLKSALDKAPTLEIPNKAIIRVHLPGKVTSDAATVLEMLGGHNALVEAARDDLSQDEQAPTLQLRKGIVANSIALSATRDQQTARMLLRSTSTKNSKQTFSIDGIIDTAFDFDTLGDFAVSFYLFIVFFFLFTILLQFIGGSRLEERLSAPTDRRDFLNSSKEPLTFTTPWAWSAHGDFDQLELDVIFF